MTALRKAIADYSLDLGQLPKGLEDLCANRRNDPRWNGPYLEELGHDVFIDPWGYRFEYTTDGETFELISRGLLGYDRDYG
jgi:hypothetical protein